VKFGDDHTATVEQMEAAITDKTAAVHYLAIERLAIGKGKGSLPIETILEVAHRHNLPVIVDAASEVFPLERLHHFTNLGADLVCFGAKYIGAYNGTGILAGRKDLLEAAYQQSFVSFETANNAAVGRPLKLDRQEVVAVVAALREWIETDHEERLDTHEKRGAIISQAVQGLDYVNTEWVPDERSLGSAVQVTIDEAALGKSAAQVQQALQAGTPSIMALSHDNVLRLTVPTLYDGEAEIVAERLRTILTTG
jgi:L-seryl-tRNA(Ser) seleniumtransferase